MNDLISIIVPVYNVEEYVGRCIDSIVGQTYTNWELILIDDGSGDGSGAICERYASDHENITYHLLPHGGVSAARNYGMGLAKGDYLLFVDSDDYIAPNMLEAMVREGEGADLIVCGVCHINLENGKEVPKPFNMLKISEKTRVKNLYFELLCKSSTLWNKLIRREIIGDLKFDEGKTYGEDMLFVASLLPSVKSAIMIPDHLYYYNRYREGNVVSEGLNNKTFEFLDNSYEVYRMSAANNEPSCGLYRMSFALKTTLKQIDKEDRWKYRKYIRYCGRVLRKIPLKNRINYTHDDRFKKRGRKMKYLYLMFPYFPYAVFGYGGMEIVWGIRI